MIVSLYFDYKKNFSELVTLRIPRQGEGASSPVPIKFVPTRRVIQAFLKAQVDQLVGGLRRVQAFLKRFQKPPAHWGSTGR